MVSIVIPTYNEAENIKNLLSRIKDSLSPPYELIVIDDNSPDGTGRIIDELAAGYPLKIIHRKSRIGLASAVVDGFKAASGELICVMDSDLSHPPEIIPSLIKNMEAQGADIVVASRLVDGGGIEKWPHRRLIGSRMATLATMPLTKVKDPMSGFFLLKKSVIKDVKLIPRGYKILLEVLVKGKYLKVIEIPFIFKDRVYGKSKLNLGIYMEFIVHLAGLYLYKLKKDLRFNCSRQYK